MRLPEHEINLQRERVVSSIIEDETDPGEVAINSFFKEIYGSHSYAFPTIGTKNSLQKIKRKDIC